MIRYIDFSDEIEEPEADENPDEMSQNRRWKGSPIWERSGLPSELRRSLPRFQRDDNMFVFNDEKDLIVRVWMDGDSSVVPVGMVSHTYQLIQHEDLLDGMICCLGTNGIDGEALEFKATLTANGERAVLRAGLGGAFEISPDGHPTALELIATNSVDGSAAIRVCLGWYRGVCTNGMFVGVSAAAARIPHSRSARLEQAFEPIARQLAVARRERKTLGKWAGEAVTKDQLVAWVDGPVCDLWGPLAASRLYRICRTGMDGRFADPFEPKKPSERGMIETNPVPGSAVPADNRYAVLQALSWIASRRNDLDEATMRQRQIGRLMRHLR